ncbi:hypothetical protein Nepgr_013855 [Nepenthes gracilis]|uniref:Uncharacterized protein n=1 Tax=Nepenthes gracilis TaxID=150966 RepID=A0AAD3XPK6_NEPGR|nr:hypothetical protein Nepgr_013855 [Nepenthes gracilis]
MLLSPGHSPRHLPSPSPSLSHSNEPSPSQSLTRLLSSSSLKKQTEVLDEDTYVAAIEKIIERDYFPDIPKLRDRFDWLEAVRSGDPVQIRDAQLKILERRKGKVSNGNAEGKIQTPGSTFFRNSVTPFDFDKTPGVVDKNLGEGEGGQSDNGFDVSLSLDEFFRRYTSEDNDSFSKIMEKVNRKRKERYGYLLEGEEREDVRGIEDVK